MRPLRKELSHAGNLPDRSKDNGFGEVHSLYALCQAVSVRSASDQSCGADGSEAEAEESLCRAEGSGIFYGLKRKNHALSASIRGIKA